MSWMSLSECDYGLHLSQHFRELAAAGISVFGISGDWGADNGIKDGTGHVGSPSSDPFVTCCGGTVLAVKPGSPKGFEEYSWSDIKNPNSDFSLMNDQWGATGGGMSEIFPTPPWQVAAGITSFTNSASETKKGGRFIPDISGMVGYTGYVIDGLDWNLAGTSAVAPLYAGLFAVVRSAFNNKRFGLLNPTLYQLGTRDAFHDVTFGNNDSVYAMFSPFFSAGVGYDPTTGWGSVDGTEMMTAIGKAFSVWAPINLSIGIIAYRSLLAYRSISD
jgi:kumamolisin